jgi:uncharacterized membrane protein (DUF4010 family)
MNTAVSLAQQQLLLGLGAALAIGLLFGLERGWHGQQDRNVSRPAGVRTFGLIGLLGGVCAVLAQKFDAEVLAWGLAALAAASVAAYALSVRETGDSGMTSLIAGLLAFALGALATYGEMAVAASAAVVSTLLLGFKPQMHAWVAKLKRAELQATLKLLLISVVMLPIIPDQGFGPGAALNPYELWWMVVLIAAISYVGYFAVKMTGAEAGVMLTGLLAGLASSTALTLQMARLARRPGADANLLGAAVLIANATLFPRILIIVALIQPALLGRLAPALASMTLLATLAAALLWLRRGTDSHGATVQLDNPLALGMALRFGLLLAIVVLLGRLASERFGDTGVLTVAAISGIADLNAITLSVARMEADSVTRHIAAVAIVLATTSNAVFKAAVCGGIGNTALGLRAGLPLIGVCAGGLLLVLAGETALMSHLSDLARHAWEWLLPIDG